MPGFDGTGPRGMGPMTGRGLGFCAIQIPNPPYPGAPPCPFIPWPAYSNRPRWGLRFGGRGRGGRGFRRGFW